MLKTLHLNNINLAILLSILVLYTSCNPKQKSDFLVKIVHGEYDEIDAECGYMNAQGDTVIALGKYAYCYTDTLRHYAIVLEKDGRCIAIDKNDRELFEVFWYDNGPDYIAEGFFRITQNGKIGYANQDGKIVITPQFDCAFPFHNGRAKVSTDCKTIRDGEHVRWESKNWYYIDKNGKKIE